MSDLISLSQIATQFSLNQSEVADLFKAAKLKSSRLVVGNEPIALFDKAEASEVIEQYIGKVKALIEQQRAEAEAAREPTMKEVMAKLKEMSKDISDVAELHEEIKRLTMANHGIFKALTDFKTDTQERMAGLKTLLIGARDEVNALKKVQHITERPALEVEKKKVAVIGISKVHHPKLQDDYSHYLELKLVDPSDIRGIHQMRKYEIVYAMQKFTDMRHADQMKSAKISPIYISGGLESLENMLDSLITP